jgi:hypothetical protein
MTTKSFETKILYVLRPYSNDDLQSFLKRHTNCVNLTLKRISVTVVTMENQSVLHTLSVCL